MQEIGLDEFGGALRRQKVLISLVLLGFLCLAFAYIFVADRKYTVEFLVTPTSGPEATIPSRLGNLAGLAGIDLGANSETATFELYLEMLKSREVAAVLAQNANLMGRLLPQEWDEETGEWGGSRGLVSRIRGFLLSETREGAAAARVEEYLEENLRIERKRNSPVVSISMEHHDPEAAADLLRFLHSVVDPSLRNKELERTAKYIAYLQDQLERVAVAEYRQALNEIIVEQEKRRMIASSDLPFSAEPFSGPSSSFLPTSPKPILVLFLALIVGTLVGIISAVVLDQRQASNVAS